MAKNALPAEPGGQEAGLDSGPQQYKELTEPSFGAAAALFEAIPTRGGVILRGSCPRCHDVMEFPHVDRVYRGLGWRPSSRASGANEGDVRMICTCTAPHPGRPDGEDGCGAYWIVSLSRSVP